MTWFALGCLTISITLTYAWWIRVRVIMFRQNLYDIRDELFDRAADCDGLEDPAHHVARQHINNIAHTAEMFSVPLFAYHLSAGVDGGDFQERLHTDNPKLAAAIEKAMNASANAVTHYLLRRTIPGILAVAFFRMTKAGNVVESQVNKWSNRWTMSDSAERTRLAC